MNKKKIYKLTIIGIVIVLLDQLTKFAIIKQLTLYDVIPIIPNFFNIVYVENPGGAFGFLASHSAEVRFFMFLIVSCLAVCFVLYFYWKIPSDTCPWLETALAMIFGGAIGNLIDRFRFGTVIDFLDFYVNSWHWPAFNVADSAISIGTTILIFHVILNKIPEQSM